MVNICHRHCFGKISIIIRNTEPTILSENINLALKRQWVPALKAKSTRYQSCCQQNKYVDHQKETWTLHFGGQGILIIYTSHFPRQNHLLDHPWGRRGCSQGSQNPGIDKGRRQTLPEAQRIQAIEYKTWIISAAKTKKIHSLVTTFPTLSSYSSATISMATITSPKAQQPIKYIYTDSNMITSFNTPYNFFTTLPTPLVTS